MTGAGAPVLCCVRAHGGGHWVVVEGVGTDGVTYLDPANGQRVTAAAEVWMRNWHDTDAEGRRWERYGIAVWPPN